MTQPADASSAADTAVITADGAVDLAASADALREVLTDISTLTVSQLVALFRQYQHHAEFPQVLKSALPHIVLPHANAAATVTSQWYDDLASARSFRAAPTVYLPSERIDKTIDWALYAPGDATALDRLSGSTKRMVFDASRDTVLDNTFREGIRWARHASANACAFCRMVASKDSSRLYRTEKSAVRVVGRSTDLTSADRRTRAAGQATTDELLKRRMRHSRGAQQRGSQALGEKWHDHCRCTAVPVRDGDTYTPPDYVKQWRQDYRDAVKAAREAGKTKGENGAIDFKAVLAHMRRDTDAH